MSGRIRILILSALLCWGASLPGPAVAAGQNETRHLRLYLAGPLGFSEAGTLYKDTVLIPKLQQLGYAVIDPWKLTPQEKIDRVLQLPYGPERRDAWKALNPEIARNNEAGIDRADAVLAVLDGTDVDSGTAAEIGFAYGRGKPVLGYRGDFRLSADNEGSKVNLQVEYFIEQRGGEVITSIDDLPRALQSFGIIARLAAGTPGQGSSVGPVPDIVPPASLPQPESVRDVVRFFEAAFTIVLALALGEAFKQFVADGGAPGSPGNPLGKPANAIHWTRLWALSVLLLFLLPFFQGMNRYFFLTYTSVDRLPAHYSLSLIFDGSFFTLEAALFFVMSRALTIDGWVRFYVGVVALLIADSIWATAVMFWHSALVEPWLKLNVGSIVVAVILLWPFRKRESLPTWVSALAVVLSLVRTILDYLFMWTFYFP